MAAIKRVPRPDQADIMAIPWSPQPGPQEKAIRAAFVTELFFGGARGGGKSDYLLGDFAADVNHYGPHWRGVLIRRTYPELDEIIERSNTVFTKAFPGAQYRVGSKTWKFPSGAVLRMRHLENEQDASHYQGSAYSWVGFDELTNWPNLRAYHKLKACLRVGTAEVPVKRIRATGNPGGPGHTAVKAYFIDPAPESTVIRDPETQDTRMFIKSRVTDNAILMKHDPGYVNRLRGVGDEALVKAWLEGDWDVFVGQYFSNWRTEQIVVKSFVIPTSWPLFGAMDYGEASPTSFGLYTVDYDGVVYRICEYYQANRSSSQHAEAINQMVANCPFTGGRKPQTIYVDPSMFTRRRLQSDQVMNSPADVFASMGLFLTAANNDRVTGWRNINDALIKRKLKCFAGWNDAMLRTVPSLPRDPKNPEDIDTSADDHVADEIRYSMMHVYKPTAKAPQADRDPMLGTNVLKSLGPSPVMRRRQRKVA